VGREEGPTHMADGWARTTGGVGVAIGTSGPAGTNIITGRHTAQGRLDPHCVHHRPGGLTQTAH
jgi:thiamine pyrophosphate-dependent acetolactate synthase large subunit-like protein